MHARIVRELLDKLKVPYEMIPHERRETALETAQAEGEDPSHVAKVVIVESNGKHKMFVLPANRKLDLFKAADGCNDEKVRVVYERETAEDFPDSEIGAEPPFGSLYGFPVFVDAALTIYPEIVFSAGSHTESLKMRTADYIEIATPQIGDYSVDKTKASSR